MNKNRRGKTLAAANTSTNSNDNQPIKVYTHPNPSAEGRFCLEQAKKFIDAGGEPSEFAILGRTQRAIDQADIAFGNSGIPYRVTAGVKFARRAETRIITSWIRLLINPKDTSAFDGAFIHHPLKTINLKPAIIKKVLLHSERSLSQKPPMDMLEMLSVSKSGIRGELAKQQVTEVIDVYKRISALVESRDKPQNVVLQIIDLLGISKNLKNLMKDEDLDEAKKARNQQESIDSLIEAASEYTHLKDLLDHTAISEVQNTNENSVTLGTIHSAKGSEWSHVIICAVEEDILPSSRSESHEEERRLLHVAATRAKRDLKISYCRERNRMHSKPSKFLAEIRNTLEKPTYL